MLGLPAIAISELNPSGTILVRGEYWNAQASTRVPASEPVRITGIDGMTLRVEPQLQGEPQLQKET
jgi:membrane-bound ClpP family serine protease